MHIKIPKSNGSHNTILSDINILAEMNRKWQIVIKIGESNAIFCTDGLTNDNLVDVIEFIPVFVPKKT